MPQVDIDESLVRYSRLLQYIDPEDEATQKSVHKTYSLWQAVWFFLLPRLSSFQMKFPRPENKLPYLETGCDCAFNPALLELYEVLSDPCPVKFSQFSLIQLSTSPKTTPAARIPNVEPVNGPSS